MCCLLTIVVLRFTVERGKAGEKREASTYFSAFTPIFAFCEYSIDNLFILNRLGLFIDPKIHHRVESIRILQFIFMGPEGRKIYAKLKA